MSTDHTSHAVRILVVDDEEPARLLLRDYLSDLPGYAVVGECGNGFEAVKAVSDLQPDVLLLDIQMPKLDGFEVLELLEQSIPVVFVTAYDEHALRAFEVHAVDYLLKPFSRDRLTTALERVRERLGGGPDTEALARAARPDGGYTERILIRDGTRVHVIPVAEVDSIEAADDGVTIHAGGSDHHKLAKISALEKKLDPGLFVRIHRSFILNIDRLENIELYAKDSRLAILKDGSKIPVSRAGYSRLKELL